MVVGSLIYFKPCLTHLFIFVIIVNPTFSTRAIFDLDAQLRGIPSDGAPSAPHYLGSANYR